MKNEFLEIGKIINKRGIAGELKVECYCDSPDSAKNVKIVYLNSEGKNPVDVLSIKDYKGFLYIKLNGVDNTEKADSLRGKLLYASRNDITIQEGKNFIVDLIGLEVVDYDTHKVYGKISDVINHGASDIYVVTNDNGNEYYVPAVKDIVVETDIENHVLVKPIPGLFDNAEEIK